MHQLSNATVKLISSSQVITSIYATVKELLENSIDAGASSIEIRLENYGLKKIQVVDNGCGIPEGEEGFIAKPHFTSKLKDQKDLASLSTLGFRGEALYSLCSVSNLSFSTKTEKQSVGILHTLDKNGDIIEKKPCTRQRGTTIISENLFKNLPVRKQFYSGNKKGKEELRKIQDLLYAYGLIMPELRITLKHNQSVIWQKQKCSSLKDAFISTFGVLCYKNMQERSFKDVNYDLKVTYILPIPSATEEVCRKTNDRVFMFINKRPVMLKNICQVVKSCCNEYVPVLQSRYPFSFLAIDLPTSYLDVNVEPNKSVVLMEDVDEIKELIRQDITTFYKEQSLSMENCADVDSHTVPQNLQYTTEVCNEAGVIQNEDLCQNRNASEKDNICEIRDNSVRPPFNASRDLFSESYHTPILQNVCKAQNLDCEVLNEAHSETEKSAKVPRLELDVTDDCSSLFEELSKEKPNGCHIVEESLSHHGAQNSKLDSQQNIQGNGCVSSPLLLNHVTDGNLPHSNIVENFVVGSKDGLRNNLEDIDLDLVEDLQLDNFVVNTNSCLLDVNDQRVDSFGSSSLDAENRHKANTAAASHTGVSHAGASHTGASHTGASHTGVSHIGVSHTGISHTSFDRNEQLSSGKQLTVDEWSRGTSMVDAANGEPLQPFRMLESAKSCATKKQSVKKKKPDIKSASCGFVQTALCTNLFKDHIIRFNLNDVRNHLESSELRCTEGISNTEMVDVIGEISLWKSWVIKLKNELYFFNPFRAYERELFDEMMKKHILPPALLEKSIPVTESLMKNCSMHGSRNWEFLQNMQFERSLVTNGRVLIDDRITSNGFEIRKRKDFHSNEVILEIVKIWTEIEGYGVSDLNEIIDKIHEVPGEQSMSSLEKCRSEKVISYFKKQAARLVSSSTTPFTKSEINNRVKKISSTNERYENIICLHGKPIFSQISTVSI